jgi:hypothetical protein
MTIMLHVVSATAAELARGAAAAEASFQGGRRSTVEVREWDFGLEALGERAGSNLDAASTEDEMGVAAAMDQAQRAALSACCEGWPEIPENIP